MALFLNTFTVLREAGIQNVLLAQGMLCAECTLTRALKSLYYCTLTHVQRMISKGKKNAFQTVLRATMLCVCAHTLTHILQLFLGAYKEESAAHH